MNAHLVEQVLFGSVLTAAKDDIYILLVMFIAIVVLAIRFGNQAFLVALSPDLAHSKRINVKLHDYGFVLLIALVTVAAVKIIGAILVGALLLIPAASARLISQNLRQMMFWSVLIASSSAILGVLVPMYFELAIATGPAVILFACLWFLLTIGTQRFVGAKA